MAYLNPDNQKCQNCNKSGLAILPVRYAVVPLNVVGALPKPMGNKVTDVEIKHHKYALRTLRAGYFYLFHEKHARGSQITWEVYSVTEAGTLWKQQSPEALKPVATLTCSTKGHNIPTSVITIESPEKCKRVWIAFSEHAWSGDTLKAFAEDEKLRDRRMQTFLPATWVSVGGYRHGLVATKENIETVIEYTPGFDAVTLNGGDATPTISDESGAHNAKHLSMQTTCYKSVARVGESVTLAKVMRDIGTNGQGKAHQPMLMAVWDAVGIAHELNGFRNDAAGWMKKYGEERELEISALTAIEGVKAALQKKAVDNEKQRQSDTRNYVPKFSATTERRARSLTLDARLQKNELEICDIVDNWASRDLPVTSGFGGRLNEANGLTEPQRSIKIAAIKAEAEKSLALREKNSPAMIKQAEQLAWPKYEEKLTPGAYQNFRIKYDRFLGEAEAIVDQRTSDLINWLKSKYLINQLTEFHGSNVDDGVVFDDQVGKMMHGINSSAHGQKLINDWVMEMKASEGNLIWRTIALNQDECFSALDQLLKEAASKEMPVGQLSVDFMATHVRKFADMYKKANTLNNTAIKSQNALEGIKKIKIYGIDRLFMTVGDKLFLPFLRRGADAAAEFAVRGLMMARAGVEPDRILSALKIQAKQEGLARGAIVQRLKIAKTFLGSAKDLKDAKFSGLTKTWETLKEHPEKGATALKENRLSLLVATLEIVNLVKIAWEFKDDERTYGELGAALCTTIAAVSDIAANTAKHVVGDKVSKTFQYLKVSGAILSAGAGYYSALLDAEKAENQANKSRYGLAMAYALKSIAQLFASTFGLLASLSYAAPLLEGSASGLAKLVGKKLLFYRLFCMTWALRINMVGLGITALIWVFTPEPLKDWCEKSPFGRDKKSGPRSSKELLDKLANALAEIS